MTTKGSPKKSQKEASSKLAHRVQTYDFFKKNLQCCALRCLLFLLILSVGTPSGMHLFDHLRVYISIIN